MKKRNLFAVFILPFVTFGIYGIVWLVKTKDEMNKQGANIPTAWLLIVPFVNFYWSYKYAEGVERVTGAKISTIVAFLLELFLGVIGNVILQSEFNKLTDLATQTPDVTTAPSAGNTINDNLVANKPFEEQTPAVPAMPPTTIAAPQPTAAVPPVPTNQYQNVNQAPEANVPAQPVTGEDNSSTPAAPSQF